MNYLEKLSNCYPDAHAYVLGNNDPTIYSNLIWATTQISQAVLDSDVCHIQSSDISSGQNIFQISFHNEGSIYNKWIGLDNSVTSDESPYVVPWKSNLIGITYSNNKHDSNINIQVFKSNKDAGSVNTLLTQWDIRDARTAFKTNMLPTLSCEAGDKIGVFLKKYNNDKPKDVILTLYFQIDINTSLNEYIESFNGDI